MDVSESVLSKKNRVQKTKYNVIIILLTKQTQLYII